MRILKEVFVVGVLLVARPGRVAAQAMVPWVTRSADNARSGWNSRETVLTQASVGNKGIVRATIIPVFGDARGMEAQPLILPNVKLRDGSTHDVMILPSMANVVRGVDARTGAELWAKDPVLGRPIDGGIPIGPRKPGPDGCAGEFPTVDCHAINDKWGVLSTGVIDPDTQRVYLVAWISPDGTPQNAKHFVFVLNVADGTQVVPPVLVDGTSGTQKYSDAMRKQRSSLVLTNVAGRKTVFWASGTVQEVAQLALELEDLCDEHVPWTHRHPPLPVTLRRPVHPLAPRGPRIQEERGAAGSCEHADGNVAAPRGIGAQTPDVRAQAVARDEARHALALILEVRRGDARPQMDPAECHDR